MGPSLLRNYLALLGWTASTLADQLGCERAIVVRWTNCTSARGVPAPVAEWISRCADTALALPAPESWRTRSGRQSYDGREKADD